MQQCNFIYKNIDTNIIQPFKLQISRGKEGQQNVVFTVVDLYKTLLDWIYGGHLYVFTPLLSSPVILLLPLPLVLLGVGLAVPRLTGLHNHPAVVQHCLQGSRKALSM